MKHISVLLTQGNSSLSNLEASYKMFNMANDFSLQNGKEPIFKVNLVAAKKEIKKSNTIFAITPDATFEDIQKTDLIIIPATHGNYQQVVNDNQEAIPWLIKNYEQGAEIASLCIGAFILASTGLLDGKHCATHWLAAQEFRQMYPRVKLVDDRIITYENGIYTSGGAYSSLNLNLYLLEKYAGREMAILSSKVFEIDIERESQAPFIIFHGQKNHDDDDVRKAQSYLETNYTSSITINEVCNLVGVGRRSFERRFKKATNNTIIEYFQRVKIEAAKKELEKGSKTINEVMFEVNYNDPKTFRELFKRFTGITPNAYRNKFAKQISA
ncbi:GlxA family transcriptional regulator [Zhouia sp. PK063]|uniref:GlxA family transcriptional regulator n=1 Tax=Zhouia sp. PK063 TaxID=3373602 RepID=UPI0037B28955